MSAAEGGPRTASGGGARLVALVSAAGAAALVAGGLALGALPQPSTAALAAADLAPGGASTPVPVPAARSTLACPGGPQAVTGSSAGSSTGSSAGTTGGTSQVASATTGLVAGGAGASLDATALRVRDGDTGSTSSSTSSSTSTSPKTATGTSIGDLLRVTADAGPTAKGVGTALGADPVDGGAPLLAGATTSVGTGDLRGLVAGACVSPAETTWLIGGSTGVGRSTRLVLADTGDAATTVDVTVLTASGPQQPSSLQGLSLGAGEQRSVLLEGVLDGVVSSVDGSGAASSSGSAGSSTDGGDDGQPVAVQVRTSAGPVAAWLMESGLHGLVPAGQEVVTPAAAPATSLLVPGVVTVGSAPAVLRVANPGTGSVVARFSIVDGDGTSVPVGTTPATAVPAGGVVDVELPGLPSGGVAVAVDADGPVTAAVRTNSAAPGTAGAASAGDIAWVPATEPLAGATLVALPPGTGRSGAAGGVPASRLVLTSSDAAAAVDVAVVGADGRTGTARRVELPATTTTAADVTDLVAAAGGSGSPVALMLTPVGEGKGTVTAALTSRLSVGGGGDLVAATPVAPGPVVRSSVEVAVSGP